MTTAIAVQTTPAVREFQKVYALCTAKIAKAAQNETRAFWTNHLAIKTHEICASYNLSADSLVSQWESWVFDVETARSGVNA